MDDLENSAADDSRSDGVMNGVGGSLESSRLADSVDSKVHRFRNTVLQ